jgi:enamine deaminase RidA (YjgF/YER057c/UK114 family)
MAEYLGKSEQQKKRAYSPAVITQGGKTVWLAGQTATQDEQGNDISGNFEAQVKTIFSLIDKTLQRCGGSLANMVTMTVFIIDPRHGDLRRHARGLLSGRQLSGECADHSVELRASRHADRDPGRRCDRRIAARTRSSLAAPSLNHRCDCRKFVQARREFRLHAQYSPIVNPARHDGYGISRDWS